jgi:hypothetical protein
MGWTQPGFNGFIISQRWFSHDHRNTNSREGPK